MIREIAREELAEKLNHRRNTILLETLPPEEYRRAHLPGALNMPPDQVRALAPELIPKKSMEVIVYCAGPTCHASEQVARELVTLGYDDVRHYAGGKSDWIEADLPVVSDEGRRAA